MLNMKSFVLKLLEFSVSVTHTERLSTLNFMTDHVT